MTSFRDAQHGRFFKTNVFVILVLVSVVSAIPARGGEESCTNPRQKAGTCIVITQCPELQSILNNRPVSEVNRLYLTESQCGQVGRHPKVCCANGEELSKRKKEEDEFDFSKKNNLIPTRRQCGPSFTDKIVGGNTTGLDQYPWMALLVYKKKNYHGPKEQFLCGGALITDRYVLTAAHCLTRMDNDLELKKIRLGEWDLDEIEDCLDGVCSDPPLNIDVESFKVHENYEPDSPHQRNDIALVRMAKPVQNSYSIDKICLPLIDERVSKRTHYGEQLLVSGWGQTEDGVGARQKQQVHVPIVNQDDCKKYWKNSKFNVANTQFCAGGREGKDSCKGDSGGPIFIREIDGKEDNWFIRGIISSGPATCGTEDAFSLYTDVTKFNYWIWKNIKP